MVLFKPNAVHRCIFTLHKRVGKITPGRLHMGQRTMHHKYLHFFNTNELNIHVEVRTALLSAILGWNIDNLPKNSTHFLKWLSSLTFGLIRFNILRDRLYILCWSFTFVFENNILFYPFPFCSFFSASVVLNVSIKCPLIFMKSYQRD